MRVGVLGFSVLASSSTLLTPVNIPGEPTICGEESVCLKLAFNCKDWSNKACQSSPNICPGVFAEGLAAVASSSQKG